MTKTITLTKKQAEYVRNANHRWNFSIGAVRSGKSFLAVQYIIPHCLLERKGLRGLNLIIGATQGNIRRNVIAPMQDIWGTTLVTDVASNNLCTIFGETVFCLGADTKRAVSRIRGSEIKFAYCDEIVDLHEEAFDMLKSRLSLPYSICHAAANPSDPTHFVKQFLDTEEKGVDMYTQHYTIYDNPFLPEAYVKSLELEYEGTVYYDRYILGLWTKAEGLVYPMYEEAIAEAPEDVKTSDICISIDYGTQNPFAALLWERKGDVSYATRGYYYSGAKTGRQKTDEEYGNDVEEFMQPEIEARNNAGYEQPKIKVIIDPSAASFIEVMRRKKWCRVIKADNDVLDGIRQTATAMKTGKIKVSPKIREWRDEAAGYVWDSKKKGDVVVKERDHYMDSTRYYVRTMHITKQRSEYVPLWN